ncbi:NAD(P)H-binding protein [Bacillaceae bacterium SIJ1]|uniref:NAD(P)H-binding protein n=1 Tax=Litoribacterium kuwaitense TaxID=1398745 RepID=UPI0013ECC6FB|nr:NAD(P)H-binding protein [Litoribacterium kuwaitense]NGP44661.1 NAD(P)H-binding protein [Litoribacterium kuwaitense]
MAQSLPRPQVVVAGASSSVGKHLLQPLSNLYDVTALSRSGLNRGNIPHLTWRSCDLFSVKDAERSLQNADYAVYLVHSRNSNATLTQARYEDMDLILADNFARAAKKHHVKQIIYLIEHIPESPAKQRRYEKSRLEVEQVLRAYGTPVTTIRTEAIIGRQSALMSTVEHWIQSRPFILLPSTTETYGCPVTMDEVIHTILASLGSKDMFSKNVQLTGSEAITYRELILRTAASMKVNKYWISLPIRMAKRWGSSQSLTTPLLSSHEQVEKNVPLNEAIRQATVKTTGNAIAKPGHRHTPSVRSVQRVPFSHHCQASGIAHDYMHWLARVGRPLLRTQAEGNKYAIYGIGIKEPLLTLTFCAEWSTPTRALYTISGGLFAAVDQHQYGRMEFRHIPHSEQGLIAIHDFQPSLPWTLYKYTQAKVHLLVMHLFKAHLHKKMTHHSKTRKRPRPAGLRMS